VTLYNSSPLSASFSNFSFIILIDKHWGCTDTVKFHWVVRQRSEENWKAPEVEHLPPQNEIPKGPNETNLAPARLAVHRTVLYFHSPRNTFCRGGPSSSVGVATDYGLDGPGIESRWGARFSARPHRPRGPPSLLYNGYRVFPGGKVRPGRAADHSPPSSAEVLEE